MKLAVWALRQALIVTAPEGQYRLQSIWKLVAKNVLRCNSGRRIPNTRLFSFSEVITEVIQNLGQGTFGTVDMVQIKDDNKSQPFSVARKMLCSPRKTTNRLYKTIGFVKYD